MEWVIIIIGVVLLLIFVDVQTSKQNKEKKDSARNKLYEIEDFSPGYTVLKIRFRDSFPRGISFDNSRKKAALVRDGNIKVIPFADIISCEAIINGESVTRTSRGDQLAGAALGGALFGEVGALAGALTGEKKHITIIKDVSVKILLNDLDEISLVIPFIETTSTVSTVQKQAVAEASKLEDYVTVILAGKNY